MQSSTNLFRETSEKLEDIYGKQEANALAFLLMEELFLLSRTEVLADKKINTESKKDILEDYISRLQKSEPIQYVFGHTDFFNLRFEVNPSVLIPRPETEELVQLIIEENKNKTSLSILDIGTGSGCIPIALKNILNQATVFAFDVSTEAIAVAKKNADLNKTEISFSEKNILLSDTEIPRTDIIVSNPPYVTNSEKKEMKENVLAHEPHLALFVEDNDPLVFYKAITLKAKEYLLPKGRLYFEINEQFGKETAELLVKAGFEEVRIIKDLSGRDRIVKGILIKNYELRITN